MTLINTRVVQLQQINTINGLSDIALKGFIGDAGAKAIGLSRGQLDLGLSINKRGELHFGPLFKNEKGVELLDGAQIV